MSNQRIPVLAIGDFAANLLLPDSEGIILAVFSKVIYLRHSTGEVIWFVTKDASMHRRAVQLAGSLPVTSVDTPYIMKNKVLILKSGCSLDFNLAKKWKTPSLSPHNALPIKSLKEHLGLFSCEGFASPAGLGIFIPEILNLTQNHPIILPSKDLELTTSQRFARPTIKHIARSCRTHDIDGIFEHGGELIGLGEGLTPSGDDFMGGLLFCIRNLQDLYKPFHPSFFDKLAEFVENSKLKTNLISYTMLKDHAYGHASETLHRFIHTLLTGRDMKRLSLLGSELIQIGHSTGWDLLTGVLTGMLLISNFKTLNTFQTHQSSSTYT